MDIRDILSKLDGLSEGIFDNDEVAAKNVQAQADLASWKENRYQQQKKWLDDIRARIGKYQELKNKTKLDKQPTNESVISKQLVESFGYEYTNEGILSKIGDKIAWPVTAATAIWDAYDRVTALPTNLPREQFKKEVGSIILKVVGEFGVFAVGAGIGAALAGATGPGALVGGIAGGLAAEWAIGDDVNKLIDMIVDKIYTPSDEPVTTPTQQEPVPADNIQQVPQDSDQTKELQQMLVSLGYNVGRFGIDGKPGKNTIAAIKQFKDDNNLDNDIAAIYELLGITPSTVQESVDNLTPIEQIQYFKQLMEAPSSNMMSKLSGWAMGAGATGKHAAKAATNAATTGAAKVGATAAKKVASTAAGAAKGVGKFAWNLAKKHPLIATVLTGIAALHFGFDTFGNIIGGDISTTADQSGKPVQTQPSQSTNQEQPSQSAPEPNEADVRELKGLASDIDVYINRASTDADPSLEKELNDIKALWAQTKVAV